MTSRAVPLLTSVLTFGALLASAGCSQKKPEELVSSARFGVFFGGQIQERKEIPFVLDPAKQTQGFRVEFAAPLASDEPVEWRIDKPEPRAPTRRRGAPPPPAVDAAANLPSTVVARAGERRLDQVVPFRPGDPLGLWNVRVVVRGKVVIDRPFEVYDPDVRARASKTDGGK